MRETSKLSPQRLNSKTLILINIKEPIQEGKYLPLKQKEENLILNFSDIGKKNKYEGMRRYDRDMVNGPEGV